MAEWKKIIVSGSGVAQLANDANYLTDYTVTSGDVTAHEGDISITESQISDFGTYSTATGVENNADVTDTANVTAAGALMDSEVTNLAEVKSFDSRDYATAAQGDKADDALPAANVSTFGGTLIDDADAGTARTTLGLGTAATTAASDYATAAQGGRADTALQDISGESVTDLTDVTSAGSGQIITAAERGSIGALNIFTGSLDANFATDAELSAVSGALASDISSIDTAVPAIVDNSGTPAFNSGITKAEVLSILNVEDGADVTDATNVTAAGALMDSEVTNLADVKAFDPADYATAAQGGKADTALQNISGESVTDLSDVSSAGSGAIITTGERSKLTNIEALADVTDATNVAAAGALMDDDFFGSNGLLKKTGTGIYTVDTNTYSTATGVENNADVTDTTNVKAALNANLGTLTIGDSNDIITIGNDLVVTGDLTVSGNTTTIDVANLNVTDQFINLNDGGVAADGGLVVEGAGVSFGWDNSEARWAFDAAGATEGQTAITADAYASAVVTSDLASYRKNGNILVSGSGEIFIYTE